MSFQLSNIAHAVLTFEGIVLLSAAQVSRDLFTNMIGVLQKLFKWSVHLPVYTFKHKDICEIFVLASLTL